MFKIHGDSRDLRRSHRGYYIQFMLGTSNEDLRDTAR
jgi:hypothetical protein